MFNILNEKNEYLKNISADAVNTVEPVRFTDVWGSDTLSFKIDKTFRNLYKPGYKIKTKDQQYEIKERSVKPDGTCSIFCSLDLTEWEDEVFSLETKTMDFLSALNTIIPPNWGVQTDYSFNVKKEVSFANVSRKKALQELLNIFKPEIQISALQQNIRIYKEMGNTNPYKLLSDQVNLEQIEINEDINELYTKIIPIGKDGLKINKVNGGLDYLTDYSYLKNTKTIVWEDNRYTIVEHLRDDARERITELSRPLIAYNLTFDAEGFKLGDKIILMSAENQIRDELRILTLTEYIDTGLSAAEIANSKYKFKNATESMAETRTLLNQTVAADGTIPANKLKGVNGVFTTMTPPPFAKVGDTWFQPHPDKPGETLLKVWNGYTWELRIDTSKTSFVLEELTKVNEMSLELKNKADAQDKSIKDALDKAGIAQSAADGAKQTANNAVNGVADVLTKFNKLDSDTAAAFDLNTRTHKEFRDRMAEIEQTAGDNYQLALSDIRNTAKALETFRGKFNIAPDGSVTLINFNNYVETALSSSRTISNMNTDVSRVTQMAEGLVVNIEGINTGNLIPDSLYENNLPAGTRDNDYTVLTSNGNGIKAVPQAGAPINAGWVPAWRSKTFALKPGGTYTIYIKAGIEGSVPCVLDYFNLNNSGNVIVDLPDIVLSPNSFGWYPITFTLPLNAPNNGNYYLLFGAFYRRSGQAFTISWATITQGTVPLPWEQTKLENTAVASQFALLKNGWAFKNINSAGDIIFQGNLADDSMYFKGKFIELDAQTKIRDAFINNLKASQILTDYINAKSADIATARINKLDINEINGDRATFARVMLNGINSKLRQTGDAVQFLNTSNRPALSMEPNRLALYEPGGNMVGQMDYGRMTYGTTKFPGTGHMGFVVPLDSSLIFTTPDPNNPGTVLRRLGLSGKSGNFYADPNTLFGVDDAYTDLNMGFSIGRISTPYVESTGLALWFNLDGRKTGLIFTSNSVYKYTTQSGYVKL